ncbi:MAG: carboxypeptidase-like regulatory domain-containing protein, partial [Longimicrobiaceae bacterium]
MFTRLVRNIGPILLLAAPAAAQETGSIRGTVVAAGTAEALAGVTVRIQGTRRAATTGAAGGFSITRLAPGGYTLQAERIGYRTATATVAVGSARAAEVRIELQPQEIALQGVTAIGSSEELREVRARLAREPGSVHLVGPEEVRATRQANLGDVLRFVPGVYAAARFGAADET